MKNSPIRAEHSGPSCDERLVYGDFAGDYFAQGIIDGTITYAGRTLADAIAEVTRLRDSGELDWMKMTSGCPDPGPLQAVG